MGFDTNNGPAIMRLDFTGKNDDMTSYAITSCQAVNAGHDQDLLIALVWALPNMKHLFRAFPEVLFIDGTHKTNRLCQPLITVGVKEDGSGKLQVVIRAVVPNEWAWLFQWLFNTAIPSVMGIEACQDVHLIITDGDSTETSQLDYALESVFITAKQCRCSWHIIHKGWDTKVKSLGSGAKAQKIVSVIKCWLQTLVKNVETEMEFEM